MELRYLTVPQFAEATGLSKREVRRRLKNGLLPGLRMDGGQWRICTTAVEAMEIEVGRQTARARTTTKQEQEPAA